MPQLDNTAVVVLQSSSLCYGLALVLDCLGLSSATNLAAREQQGLRRAEEVLRSINADVSPETQALYDALAKTYVVCIMLLTF